MSNKLLRRKVALTRHKPTPPVLLIPNTGLVQRDSDRKTLSAILIAKGWSFRKAARRVHMAPSILWYRYTNNMDIKIDFKRRTALSVFEEQRVVSILKHYAEHGRPLTRTNLIDVVAMIITQLPEKRLRKLPFKNVKPGLAFCCGFEKRHIDTIMFHRQRREDATRYAATNAEILVKYFAQVEHLIRDNNIDEKRIVNVDETGISACKERSIAVVHGNRDCARPLVVLPGTKMRVRRYQHRSDPDKEYLETIADCLPRVALVTTRREVSAVDSNNFRGWAEAFVEDCNDLRANERKLLLIYDGYRSHLSIPVLELFGSAGIIAYALPAHTSGTTQPLDVVVFSAFKNRFRELTHRVTSGSQNEKLLDEFDVCRIITRAYKATFTFSNIAAGFKKAGIVPLDEYRLFSQARPHSLAQPTRIASVEDMFKRLDERRSKSAEEIIGNFKALSSGFLDTTYGAVVTSEAALSLLKLPNSTRREKARAAKEEKELARAQDDALRRAKRDARKTFEKHRSRVRFEQYGEPERDMRSLKERAAAAKARFRNEHDARVLELKLVDSSGSD